MQSDSYYRWDVQGLRAVSVLMVMLFHLDEHLMPGGHFGVDVFFVISGFVITALLLREFEQTGRIDIASFYSRRARRLLPNASTVLFAVLVAAMLFLQLHTLEELASDVIAAALYVSNFHFANLRVDYFASNRAPSAVMHYWLLSVEEQFYIVGPVAISIIGWLFAPASRRPALGVLLVTIWIVSLALCLYVVRRSQPVAFFHTGTRVWELATGSLLAFGRPHVEPLAARRRGMLAVSGVILIAAATALMSERFSHPGPFTLVPVLGAALVLVSAMGTDGRTTSPVNNLLATPVMVALGNRSYSLYLWHWPVFVYGKKLLPFSGIAQALTLLLLTFALSELAYRYIETPWRTREWGDVRRWRPLKAAAALIAVVCATAIAGPLAARHMTGGDATYWAEQLRLANLDDGGVPYRTSCHRGEDAEQPECAFADTSSPKTVLLFGDSHAAHWFHAYEKAAVLEHWRLLSWSKSACPSANVPLFNPHKKALYESCTAWRNAAFERLRQAKAPMLVVLSNSNGYSGWAYVPGEGVVSGRAAEDAFERGLIETVKIIRAAGHRVAIVRDTPLADPSYKDCIAKNGHGAVCQRPRSKAINPNNVEARVAAQFPDVVLMDLNDRICDSETCPVVKDGKVIYRDDSHLTIEFVSTLFEPIRDLLRRTVLEQRSNRASKASGLHHLNRVVSIRSEH